MKVSLINHPGFKLDLHLLIQVYSAKLSPYNYGIHSTAQTICESTLESESELLPSLPLATENPGVPSSPSSGRLGFVFFFFGGILQQHVGDWLIKGWREILKWKFGYLERWMAAVYWCWSPSCSVLAVSPLSLHVCSPILKYVLTIYTIMNNYYN